MSEVHEEFRNLKTEISKINIQRGGGSAGLKGFYAEHVNAANDNISRIESEIDARQIVIDNNGDADAIIRYSNGQFGRKIQYKNGYQYSKHKEFLSSGKYDGMIYAINKDNPIFSNQKQLETLNALAKEHNIKLVQASVSDKEMQILAYAANLEGNVRSSMGINATPKIILEIYVDVKEVEYYFEKIKEKQAVVNNFIADQTSLFLNEDLARINSAGINQALSTAQFAAAMSVAKNALSLIKGDEESETIAKSVLKDISTAAVMGYATGTVAEFIGIEVNDAAFLVNGTIQISKQICAYANGNINERQLLQNVAETSVYLTAAYIGKSIGGAIGSAGGSVGMFVGQFIGEMVTTAICSTVIETIDREEKANKHHKKMLALAHRAETEIRKSQDRLVILVRNENSQFIDALNNGYDRFIDGLLNYNYEKASMGLSVIGEGFGVDAEKLTQGYVTKGNIFEKKNRVVNLG